MGFEPKYVLGFLFNEAMDRVVVLKKKHPVGLAGFITGVGGKVELGETAAEAMRREFREEAGLDVERWLEFARFTGTDKISCFFARSKSMENASTQTDEDVFVLYVWSLMDVRECFHNTKFLVQMAQVVANGRARPYEIKHIDA